MTACPTPDKTAFPTKHAAVVEAARIKHDRRGPGGDVYECACGSFHLTRGTNLTRRIRAALHHHP